MDSLTQTAIELTIPVRHGQTRQYTGKQCASHLFEVASITRDPMTLGVYLHRSLEPQTITDRVQPEAHTEA